MSGVKIMPTCPHDRKAYTEEELVFANSQAFIQIFQEENNNHFSNPSFPCDFSHLKKKKKNLLVPLTL